jgi:hypothetical protein
MKAWRSTVVVTAIACLLAFAPSAFAASATQSGYQDAAGSVQSQVAPDEPARAANRTVDTSSDAGDLPFTGLDVAFVALAGLGLVGLGFGLRTVTRRQTASS